MDRLRDLPPNHEVWWQIGSIFGPVICNWVRPARLTGSRLADVFQAAFIAVSQRIGTFKSEGDRAIFRAWLKTVTLAKVANHFHQQRKQSMANSGLTVMMRIGEIETAAAHDKATDGDGAFAQGRRSKWTSADMSDP